MRKVVVLSTDENLEEMRALLDTLGFEVIREFLQNRLRPHPVSFLGPGKIDDIRDNLKDVEFDHVVINGLLKPSQHHFLEMKFQKECLDRTGVILRIFSEHARTPEATAQVLLARLKYEQPFLREWIHKAKSGERPGFLSGGAYATDVYYEHARTQTRRIEEKLIELSKERENRRASRRGRGYALVALAGYTNAGKSSILNALSGSEVEVDDRLFSTLSTTTRKMRDVPGKILITDTVGFIRNLPTDLVNAFKATLQEVYEADLILLVVDVSDDVNVMKEKLRTSIDIVNKRSEETTVLVVGNKLDLVSHLEREERLKALKEQVPGWDVVLASAKTGDGLARLRELISARQSRSHEIVARLPITDQALSLISRLHELAIVQQTITASGIDLRILCTEEDSEKIEGWLKVAGGQKEGPRNT